MKPSDKYGHLLFGSMKKYVTVQDWAMAYNSLRESTEAEIKDLQKRLDACESGWAQDTADYKRGIEDAGG